MELRFRAPYAIPVPVVDVDLVLKALFGGAGCTCGVGEEPVELLVEEVDLVHQVAVARGDLAPERFGGVG